MEYGGGGQGVSISVRIIFGEKKDRPKAIEQHAREGRKPYVTAWKTPNTTRRPVKNGRKKQQEGIRIQNLAEPSEMRPKSKEKEKIAQKKAGRRVGRKF